MTSSKFDCLWRLMSTYTMEIDGDIPSGVLCAICCKLLIDPYAAECGCQFCGECIKDYLKDDIKKCPISKDGCSDEVLKIDGNVFKDVRTYNNIKKVIVKCPIDECVFSGELMKMEDHINECKSKQLVCPFKDFGCGDVLSGEESVEEHFHINHYSHALIALKMNIDLRADVDKLKEILKFKEMEIKELKENDGGRLKKEMDDFMECFREEIRQKLVDIKINIEDNSSAEMNKLKERLEILNSQIIELKQDRERSWKEIEKLRECNIRNENLTGGVEAESEIKEVESSKTSNGTLTNDHKEDLTKNENIQISNFTWIIDHFSEKVKKVNTDLIYLSDPFYRDNYKLCLCGKITELAGVKDNQYLELYFIIMRGDQDDICKWPMKHTVELSIINQRTTVAHKVGKYSHDKYKGQGFPFLKPEEDMNECVGGLSMSLKLLTSAPGILVNDSVEVACSITADTVPI